MNLWLNDTSDYYWQIAKLESWHWGEVTYNQIVTWTAFAILAMFWHWNPPYFLELFHLNGQVCQPLNCVLIWSSLGLDCQIYWCKYAQNITLDKWYKEQLGWHVKYDRFCRSSAKGGRCRWLLFFASWLLFAGFHKAAGAGNKPENLWRSDIWQFFHYTLMQNSGQLNTSTLCQKNLILLKTQQVFMFNFWKFVFLPTSPHLRMKLCQTLKSKQFNHFLCEF